MGAGPGLGWLLDVERVLARAHRPLARVRIRRTGVRTARPALLRTYRLVLARSPVLQYLARPLSGSLPPAPPPSAGPLRCASGADHARMFRYLPACGLGLAMDPCRTPRRPRDHRLRMGDLALRLPAFRRAFSLPFARGPRRLHSDETLRSFLRLDGWRRARFCRGHSRRS